METLAWIQKWYSDQCNEEWEHHYGVTISNIDNPGWSVKIDLIGTNLEDKEKTEEVIERSKDDWLSVKVENNIFEGVGGLFNLEEILKEFKNFVDGNK